MWRESLDLTSGATASILRTDLKEFQIDTEKLVQVW